MKNLYLVGAGIGIILLTLLSCGQAKADPLVDQVFNPSVQLGDYCSGEIIYSKRNEQTDKVNTIVLTAKHCVMDDPEKLIPINKAVYDNKNRKTGVKTYIASVLGQSYKSDLAVLKLRDHSYLFDDVAKVAKADTPLAFGQSVVVVGYPLGRSMTYTEGNLGYVEDGVFNDISQSKQFYRATPDIAPGSSGSSMFTFVDGEYQIIGVVTGGASRLSWFNFFTPVEEINEYLDVVSKTFDKDE